jgi:trk system potassium uptake protein TrkH
VTCSRIAGIRGFLWTLAPALVAWTPLPAPLALGTLLSPGVWPAWLQLAAALCVGVGGLFVAEGRRAPRALASLGLLLFAAMFALRHLAQPQPGFVVLVGLVWSLAYLWPADALRRHLAASAEPLPLAELPPMLLVATFCAASSWLRLDLVLSEAAALSATLLVPVGWLVLRRVPELAPRRPALALAAALAVVPVLSELAGKGALQLLPLALASPALVWWTVIPLWSQPRAGVPTDAGVFDAILNHPPRSLVGSFLALCGLGTALLVLPTASASGQSLPWIDAAFTAVSASCVTGLIVLDTPNDLSFVGQFIVVTLIQVGGLGIMVFSAAAVVLSGRRLSMSHEAAAVHMVGALGRSDLLAAIKRVVLVSLATEAIAAVVLFTAFVRSGDNVLMAAWRAVFTAISAFCNAGFALQSDSLIPYAHDPLVLGTVGATLFLGGLGPIVVIGALRWRPGRRLSLHNTLVLATSLILLIAPMIAFAAFEWQGALAGLSTGDKLINALFQSASIRTAGFNSVPFENIRPATWTLCLALMFVGGSPGSTAGGLKTTTVAVVFLAVAAAGRGRERVEVAGRTIPANAVFRALALTIVGGISVLLALTLVQLTQTMRFEMLIFEVFSALATMGLSMGGTAMLDEVGKVSIMICMFIGRAGPLTLFLILAARTAHLSTTRYPDEQVAIG